MEDLFNLTEKQYRAERKAWKLRRKIENTTLGLGIKTDHDETGHYYLFNGKRLPSVTAKLQILKDPSLANWKMNRALEYIKQNIGRLALKVAIKEDYESIFDEAKLAPQLEFEGAGDIGKAVHNWRENWFRDIIENGIDPELIPAPPNYPATPEPSVMSGCRAVNRFVKDTGYIPLACELFLADEKLNIGGTGDDIGLLDGKVAFIDLKTSNIADKDSYFYQVALYVCMFERLYHIRTQVHKILHVSKTDGTYKLLDIPDIRRRIREAKQIIKVDAFLAELREAKKKVPIVI